MKAVFVAALSLAAPLALSATPAAAQQDSAERARIEELTRRLNGAPPAPQRATTPAAQPTPQPARQAAPQPTPQPTQRAVAPQGRERPAPPPAAARQDPAERARIEELTRRLNGAPPSAGSTAPSSAAPSRPPQAQRPSVQTPPAQTPLTQIPLTQPTQAQQAPVAAPRPQPAPQPASSAPQRAPAPVATPTPAPAPAAPIRRTEPVPAPTPQGLSVAERAALPFIIDLPAGFQLVEGRAAPGAQVYSARKAGKTYLMIYAGPTSQFPIYDGDHVTVGSRVSVVTTEGQRRIAMEHLFQRATEPAEIHVWVMAQDGADRDEAERIAQTVDPK
ncbi:hypothetical protein EJ082_09470 [Brevundimonas diminuta]|jgi:hypothetical protein|uniref:Uncharacterized protein n=1 Tax=Brevundimonas diminuta TaxID=293 RepID=A0A410P0X6_BREDI|nr:hypothetical protein [Brevundimonas diminuta]MBD3573192.1 hypothetical protein [Brevundimonas diminuta]QAT15691.1 hypothetical protein EQG53_15805 [Brevundimonas diminuta]QQB90092.1 hypothetical protein I6H83_06650 [Brevundimonas diminuta]GEB99447.1 hypothetical protein BDI01nite_05120 [Brevundimonas diminuta]